MLRISRTRGRTLEASNLRGKRMDVWVLNYNNFWAAKSSRCWDAVAVADRKVIVMRYDLSERVSMGLVTHGQQVQYSMYIHAAQPLATLVSLWCTTYFPFVPRKNDYAGDLKRREKHLQYKKLHLSCRKCEEPRGALRSTADRRRAGRMYSRNVRGTGTPCGSVAPAACCNPVKSVKHCTVPYCFVRATRKRAFFKRSCNWSSTVVRSPAVGSLMLCGRRCYAVQRSV